MKEFFVYILFSERFDRFYIGQTSDLNKRLERHNRGYVRSTKGYSPWIVVHQETFATRSESVKRESYLKSLKSKEALKKLAEASR